METLTTDEVENYMENKKRVFVKIPVAYDETFYDEQVIKFLKDLEESSMDLEIIIFAENQPEHPIIKEKDSKYKITSFLLSRLHLDVFAFAKIIVSLPADYKEFLEKKLDEHSIVKPERNYQ